MAGEQAAAAAAPLDEEPFEAVCAKVAALEFINAASHAQLVWAKVGSYPFWPAQVVPDSVIPSHPILSNCKPPKAASVALSFFGDYTVSYLSDDRVLSWKEGVAHAFHTSAPERRNKNLLKSIREAAAFLAVGGVRRVAPPTWWCSPPAYDPNLPHLSPKKSAPKPAPAPKTKAQKDDKVVKGVKQPVQTKHSARAVHKVPAAPTPRAAVPLSPRADAGGSKEKIRWSARDVLKPLVNRLKQLYPALAAEETPSATEDLHNYITARFGTYLDIDNNLKGKTPFDLLAEMFTKLTGRQFTGDQLAGCFSAPDVAHYKLNPVALRALGIDLTAYKLPLKGNVPARAQTSAPKAVAAAAAAAAAVAPRRPAVTLTDASAPSLRVVNGRIMFQAGKRGRPSGAADSDDSGALNSAAVAAVAPGIDPRYAQPPSYVHIKQNVWVSRPKPKRLPREETAICNCRPPPLPVAPAPKAEPEPALPIEHLVGEAKEVAGVEEDDASIVRRVVEEIFAPFFGGDAAPTLEQVALQPESAEPVLEPVGRSGRPSSRARSASNGLAAAVAAVRKGSRSEKPAVKDSGTPLPRDGCGEGCLNRLSFIHCDVKTCPCGERCSNRPFYQQEHPDVEVFLTTDKGWGVRAAESIPRGQFIAEYLGEVVDEIEMAARMEDARLRNEPHFYMMEMAPGMIIDARPKGNIARLLNSSCDPNCETQKWFDAATSEIRVGIFTLRDVAPGEELVYDYHFQQLFGLDGDEAEYSCKCGAANCRGSMDTQPERSKDFGRRVEVYWPEAEAYVAATVTGYIAGTKRHIIKYDNEKVEKVCLKDRQYKWLDGNGDSAPLTAPAAAKKTKRAATVVAPAIAAVAAAMDAAQPPSVAVTPAPDTAAVSAAASFAAPLDSAVEVAEVPVKRGRGRPSGTSLGKPPKPTRPPLMAQNGPAAAVPSQQVPQELLHLVRQIMPTLGEDVALDGHALHARLRPVLPAVMRQVAAVADSLLPTPGSDVWVPETGPNSAVTEPSVPAVHEADGAPGSDTDHMEIDAVAGVAEALVSSVEAAVMGPEGEETSVVAAVADALTSSVEAAVMASNKADLEKQGAADDGAHAEVRAVLESMVSRIAADADGEEPPRKRVAYGGPPLLAELRWAAAELDPCTASAMCSAVQGQLDALMKFLEAAALPNGNGVVVVDNHGAQHTAGKLHGNGRSAAPARRAPATSISGRGRKRQKKNFGDEYVQEEITFDHDNAPQAVAEVALDGQAPEPSSPPRPSNSEVNAQAAAATLSPGLEAAATIAALHNQVAEPPLPLDGGLGGRRSSLSQGAAGRRSLPTPGSTGLPARTILVAKRLTNSDVSKGRILLPRAAVEANLSFAIGRAHSLVAKDHEGQCWEFTLQSWANGIESRRVFVLEHAGDYVRRFALKPDDVIGISTNEAGEFLVEFNTEEVCNAAETQQAARAAGLGGGITPAITPGTHAGINPLIQHNSGRCTRSEYCNKPAGHPGFCMRTPGHGRGRRPGSQVQAAPRPPSAATAKRLPSFDDVGRPKRSRRPSMKASSSYGVETDNTDEEADHVDAAYSEFDQKEDEEEVMHPISPHANAMYHDDDEDATEGAMNALEHYPTSGRDMPKQQSLPLPAAATTATPPPEPGPSVPPIFVMAPDQFAPPQMPPHVRSPLRPSLLAKQHSLPLPPAPRPHHTDSAASLPAMASMPSLGMDGAGLGGAGATAAALGDPGSALPLGALPPTLPLSVPHPNQAVDVAAFLANHSPPEGANGAKAHLPQGLALPLPVQAPTLPEAPGVEAAGGPDGTDGSPAGGHAHAALPAAPLPLFGAPPPPHAPGLAGGHHSEQAEFDYMSFLDGGK